MEKNILFIKILEKYFKIFFINNQEISKQNVKLLVFINFIILLKNKK